LLVACGGGEPPGGAKGASRNEISSGSYTKYCSISLRNDTSQTLVNTYRGLEHGVWDYPSSVFPKVEPGGDIGPALAHSDGLFTGCAGSISYGTSDGRASGTIVFENPFSGDNSWACTV